MLCLADAQLSVMNDVCVATAVAAVAKRVDTAEAVEVGPDGRCSPRLVIPFDLKNESPRYGG